MRIQILMTDEMTAAEVKIDRGVEDVNDLEHALSLAASCASHFLGNAADLEAFFDSPKEEQ